MKNKITARAIVAAVPGSHLVTYYGGRDGDHDRLSYEPIIAWAIACYEDEHIFDRRRGRETLATHVVLPLTVHGDVEENIVKYTAIKRPDGRFDTLDDIGCDDEAALIEAFQERRAEDRRRAAARATVATVPRRD